MSIQNSTRLPRFSLILFALTSTITHAAFYDSRAEKWEFFLAPQFTNSKDLQFSNGSEVRINERSSLGFGFGYNLNHHIELTGLFASSNANYIGTIIPEDGTPAENFSSNLYTSSLDFGFTYNVLSTAFTPYITANIGTTYIDSGIPTGEIGTGCGWYWGWYYCGPVAQTFTTTEINYGLGAGLRYDFNRKLYIKGGVAKNYIDIGSSNTPDFTTYQFIFGLMF